MTFPIIHNIEKITFPKPDTFHYKNGITAYGFNGVKNDILRIEILFDAGRWTEQFPLQAEFAARLIKSGTTHLSAFEIEEKIDSFGSTVKCDAGNNTVTVSVFCMNKYLDQTLEVVFDCLNNCTYQKHEIDIFKSRKIAGLLVAQEKNDYIADVLFRKTIFGETHPYGYETTKEIVEAVTQDHLLEYFNTNLIPAKCTVFISGKYEQAELDIIEKYIGNWNKKSPEQNTISIPELPVFKNDKIHIKKEKSVQASIVIGNISIQRDHEDFPGFVLLNTIFGGYFGSRLMSNIREEKGLTYGIYSSLSLLKKHAVFSIQTDTNLENKAVCLQEIYLEIERLKNELIPEDEITIARNYLLGKYLHRTDGAFNQMELFKTYYIESVNISKFEHAVETIRQQDAVSLQRLARNYFLAEKMLEVVVG
ncbi:MAG: pitrilysin family protein [Chitinophagales bacterium]